jgi:hypothetical protein
MRRLLAIIFAAALLVPPGVYARGTGGYSSSHSSHYHSSTSTGDHYVHGYTKKNGTVVQGYHATNPNGTKSDNYSTKGNVNPYTGKKGMK